MVVAIVVAWTLLLFALVALGIFKKWTFWMKVSPLIVYILSMVFLFIPMGSGAPAGPLTVMAYSVQVAPHVSGIVTEIPIKAGVPVKKGDLLLKIDPTPFAARVDQIKAQLELAKLRREQKETLAERGTGRRTDLEQFEAEVNILNAQLKAATWDLEQTEVRAPGDGYVPNQGIQPGARVNAGVPIMPFLDITRKTIALKVRQNGYRNIQVGQPAEVALEMYPGQIFKGKVTYIVPANATGELMPTGLVAQIKSASEPFLVELELDEPPANLPPGAVGTAAVYTESLRLTHPVRRVILRGRTWLNYL